MKRREKRAFEVEAELGIIGLEGLGLDSSHFPQHETEYGPQELKQTDSIPEDIGIHIHADQDEVVSNGEKSSWPLSCHVLKILFLATILSSNIVLGYGFIPSSSPMNHMLLKGHSRNTMIIPKNHHHHHRHFNMNTLPFQLRQQKSQQSPLDATTGIEQDANQDHNHNMTQKQSKTTREHNIAPPANPTEMIDKFKSYAINISKTRNGTVRHREHPRRRDGSATAERQTFIVRVPPPPTSKSAIRSLLYTLEHEAWSIAHMSMGTIVTNVGGRDLGELREYMNRAVIQGIRSAADHGDYIMIHKLVNATIQYAQAVYDVWSVGGDDDGDDGRVPLALLEPRLFGEAIAEMGSKTKANDSKLKKIWSLFMSLNHDDVGGEKGIMMSKPTAYELNAMILALGKRGRVRAAINIYREYSIVRGVECDEGSGGNGNLIANDKYTASALMTILADSIASDAIPNKKHMVPATKENSRDGPILQCSPCWQWREAASILYDFENRMSLNNHVYAAALKVNEQAMELYKYPGNRHSGAKVAMSILERMQKRKISPDVVTCSIVMSAFDKGKQWKAALALLKAMEKSGASGGGGGADGESDEYPEWELPLPNAYTYASVISSCARSGQYDHAMTLLDQIRGRPLDSSSNGDDSTGNSRGNAVVPNSWIYNSALAACVPSTNQDEGNATDRFESAIQILQRMEEDAENGFDTLPDTISYNTALATISGLGTDEVGTVECGDDEAVEDVEWRNENLTIELLDKMEEKKLSRDPGTYRNAITACSSHPESAVRILYRALDDSNLLEAAGPEWDTRDNVRLYLVNVALSACSSNGEMGLVAKLLACMKDYGLQADSRSMLSLIKGLSASGSCEDSMIALNAMKGDGAANEQFIEKYGIDIIDSGISSAIPMIEEEHYSAAITGCLRHGQLFPALKILNAMKLHSLKPNQLSLQGIIMAYCKLATEEATIEFRKARKDYAKAKSKGPIFKAIHSTSRTRASAALAMMKTLTDAPIKLQCVVASACAASGMWYEAREILWSIHIAAVLEKKRESTVEANNLDQGSAIAELPKLHRSLLKLCARSGNVTAALSYVDAIQDLNEKFSEKAVSQSKPSDPTTIINTWDTSITSVALPEHGIGMTGEDWKLLMIAASKSAHWRVCLGTLPFIKPFVEATHPRHVASEKGMAPSMKSLNREYEKISRSLTAAVLAFEVRSQYAWAIRAIDDWVQWSGRRPAREAIFSACRILASRGVGSEVVSLVKKVLQIPDRSRRRKISRPTYTTSYEMAVYTEAITALYNHGLYESADELYVNAISEGFLPFAIIEETANSQLKLDLHGMNRAIAHSAVRVSLQHLVQSKSITQLERDVLIVTGRGMKSQQHLRPVLRPEVQRMLVEEFYPPLSSSSVPRNLGALVISKSDANSWIEHQQEQKSVRFLAVADLLKTISTGSRLKKILSQRLQKFPPSSE